MAKRPTRRKAAVKKESAPESTAAATAASAAPKRTRSRATKDAAAKAQADQQTGPNTPATAVEPESAAQRRERESLEDRIAKLERESAERDREHEEERAKLHKRLAELTGSREPVVMRGTALDTEKSKQQLRAIWPRDSEMLKAIYGRPAPKGKTYRLTPLGESAGNLLPAVIENCADEGDAKREYFARTGATPHKTMLKVEPAGETKRKLDEQDAALDRLADEVDQMDATERLKLSARAMGAGMRQAV